ncbi:hypothetical protein CRE_14949 [Caenorhabditis remanei]|uniref:PAZ domain-containing protein n=1 Tax=Caenorhabditis remanei TaxID=31234 RepID=E3NBW3_CAERE|nr:hypothetical protein CRE_14949 [Caenorhabditis remanei]
MTTAQLNFQLRNKRPVYLEFLHRNESGIIQFTDDWTIDRTLLYQGRRVTVQQYFEDRYGFFLEFPRTRMIYFLGNSGSTYPQESIICEWY